MNFKEKALNILRIIGAWVKTLYLTVKQFVLANKKLSMIIAIALVAVIVILVVVFGFIKPKWDYSHKEVGDTGYTQSEIEEIGDWWQEYIQGDNIYNEGNMPLEK